MRTVWIGSDYGFAILLDKSASENHTHNSTIGPLLVTLHHVIFLNY